MQEERGVQACGDREGGVRQQRQQRERQRIRQESHQGAEEEAVPSVEVFVSTNLLTLTLTSIAQVTGDSNLTLNTNLLTVGLGDEDAVPNTLVSVSTNLLNVSVGAASGEVLSTVSVTGVNMTASTGRLFISAWAVVNIGVTNTWSVVDIAA